jgi:hypothetical protein
VPGQASETTHPILNQLDPNDHATVAPFIAKAAGHQWRGYGTEHIGAGATLGKTTGPDGVITVGNWIVPMGSKPGPDGEPPLKSTIWNHCDRLTATGKPLPTGVKSHIDTGGKCVYTVPDEQFKAMADMHLSYLEAKTPIGTHGITVTATCVKAPTKGDDHIHVGVKIHRTPPFKPDGSYKFAEGPPIILSKHIGGGEAPIAGSKSSGPARNKDIHQSLYGLSPGSKVEVEKWKGFGPAGSRPAAASIAAHPGVAPSESTDEEEDSDDEVM